MLFRHSAEIWQDFPELAAGVVYAGGITDSAQVDARVDEFAGVARSRLASGPEGEFAEIRAWRRTFSRMGLKPTQYRCAAESLLRRFRREGGLPRIHPLVDLCNAASLAFAIPVAVLDAAELTDAVVVRYAAGDEVYLTFSGDQEQPAPGEVIYADGADRAHARRWTNRQSACSAVRSTTRAVLIVAEAMHESADSDVRRLTDTIADLLGTTWAVAPKSAALSRSADRFDF